MLLIEKWWGEKTERLERERLSQKARSLKALACMLDQRRGQQFASVTSVVEQILFCILSDVIELQSDGGHYSGCHNVQTAKPAVLNDIELNRFNLLSIVHSLQWVRGYNNIKKGWEVKWVSRGEEKKGRGIKGSQRQKARRINDCRDCFNVFRRVTQLVSEIMNQ